MRWNDEWFRTAVSEHKHIVETLHDLLHANVSEKKRKDLYREVRRSIALHFLWEEETIFAQGRHLMKNEALMRVSTAQHGRINRLINAIDATDWGTYECKKNLVDLGEAVNEHVQFEESSILPALRTAVARARARAAAKGCAA